MILFVLVVINIILLLVCVLYNVVVFVFFKIFIDLIFFGLILFKLLCSCLLIIIKGELDLFYFVLLWSIMVGVFFGLLEFCVIFKLEIVLDNVCVGLEKILIFNDFLLILEIEFVILVCNCFFL